MATAGYTSLEQLAQVTEADLARMHGIGAKAIDQLRQALAAAGLSFASRPSDGRHPRSSGERHQQHLMPRTDTASRFIAAAPERVYAALLDPEALTAWVPPGDMTGSIEQFDARPGGSYRMVLTYPDVSGSRGKSTPGSDIVEARFIELVSGERVVYAVDFVSDDPAYAGTMTMRWELTAVDEGTRVEITADNVPDGVSPQDHVAGMTSSLDKLAQYLEL